MLINSCLGYELCETIIKYYLIYFINTSDSCGEPGTPAPPGPPGGQGCSPSAGFVPTYPPHPDGVRFCGFRECGLFPPGVTRYTCPNGFANDKCGCEVCDCGKQKASNKSLL